MFGILAAIAYGIGYVEQGTGGHTSAWFSPLALLIAGGFFLSLHLLGIGATWLPRR